LDTLNHEDKLNAEVKEDYRAHDTEIRTQYVNQISELTNENHELRLEHELQNKLTVASIQIESWKSSSTRWCEKVDELQAQLVRYEERQVIHLAWNKEMSITNNKLKNLLLVEEIKNHELRLEHGLWDKHSLVDIIYENKELRAQLASCVEALTESDKYLADGKLNQIGFGSILHRMIKDAIDSLPATAKPLSTKKMDMIWDLIKDVDDGGRNE